MTIGRTEPPTGVRADPGPRFSIVSAVYNVGRYLPEFMASIEAQSFDLGGVEVIVVDDGSTDDSLVMLKEWAARRPGLVTVLTKENGGQASARNVGLAYARGEWVTFTDPDDKLDRAYFAVVDGFLRAHPETALVATPRIFFDDQTGEVRDRHPLRRMFAGGDQVVDLGRFPDYFHGSAPAAFFRRELIEREGLRFDTRIRPHFEDGHFCARYLLAAPAPLVGFAGAAHYIYRRRSDGTSTLQTGVSTVERFVAVPRYGYLDLLARRSPSGDYAPPWIQALVLYDLSYYFSTDVPMPERAAGDTAAEFVAILRELAALLDPVVIGTFAVRRYDPVWRDILLHGLTGEDWVTPYAVATRSDPETVRICYRFVGAPPAEQIHSSGQPIEVLHGKIWSHQYFAHDLLFERVAWVSSRADVEVLLNGAPTVLVPDWPEADPVSRPADEPPRLTDPATAVKKRRPLRVPTRIVRRLADSWPVRRRFAGAWALTDGDDLGGNAELLFTYLREQRPEINAWYVLPRGSSDWDRLTQAGHGRRLIRRGGVAWRWLMLNSAHLISSRIELSVRRPPELVRMREPSWRLTYLQQRVSDLDRSRQLNPARIDVLCTATLTEQESIAGDYTHYRYTTREAKPTGLARFDQVWTLAAGTADRDLILLCLPPRQSAAAPAWQEMLGDKRLHGAAEEFGLRLCLVLAPETGDDGNDWATVGLPVSVQLARADDRNVGALIARAAALITERSPLAYDAAYLGRPLIYLRQPDQSSSGTEYFDLRRDGFGPVVNSAAQAVTELVRILESDGQQATAEYQERMAAAFVARDGRCRERIVTAIETLTSRE